MEAESPCERFLNGNLVQTSFKIVQNILVLRTNVPFPYRQFKNFSHSLTVQAGTKNHCSLYKCPFSINVMPSFPKCLPQSFFYLLSTRSIDFRSQDCVFNGKFDKKWLDGRGTEQVCSSTVIFLVRSVPLPVRSASFLTGADRWLKRN